MRSKTSYEATCWLPSMIARTRVSERPVAPAIAERLKPRDFRKRNSRVTSWAARISRIGRPSWLPVRHQSGWGCGRSGILVPILVAAVRRSVSRHRPAGVRGGCWAPEHRFPAVEGQANPSVSDPLQSPQREESVESTLTAFHATAWRLEAGAAGGTPLRCHGRDVQGGEACSARGGDPCG